MDGLVALTATRLGAAAIATSDPNDVQAYLNVVSGGDAVVPVLV
ncbi:hypothetical protein [Streptomyces sp. NPDC048623]